MINMVPKTLVFKNNGEIHFVNGIFSISSASANNNVVLLIGWFVFPDGTEEKGEVEFEFAREVHLIEFFDALFKERLNNVKTTFFFIDGGSHEVLNTTVNLRVQKETSDLDPGHPGVAL